MIKVCLCNIIFIFFLSAIAAAVPIADKKMGVFDFQHIPDEYFSDFKNHFGNQLLQNKPSALFLDEIIRYLHTRPRIEKVRIYQLSDGSYLLDVQQSLLVGDFQWQGLTAFSDSEARSFFSMRKDDVFVLEDMIQSADRLREAYKAIGYLNAEIDLETPSWFGRVETTVRLRENQQTKIFNINIQSENLELNKQLHDLVKKLKGQPYSLENLKKIEDTFKNYLRKNNFITADLQGPSLVFSENEATVDLEFKVAQPIRYSLDFSGILLLSKSSLISDLNLENYSSKSQNLAVEIANLIQQYYVARGYTHATVQHEERSLRSYLVSLNFMITEGPRVFWEDLVFTGQFSRSTMDYKKLLKQVSSEYFKKNIFIKSDFDAAIEAFQIELQNQGYLLAKVSSTRTQFSADKKTVKLFVNFDEGPMTLVNEIQFQGNNIVPDNTLLAWLDLRQGEPLRFKKFEDAILKIKSKYRELGFIEMQILNEKKDLISYDQQSMNAKIQFQIQEGPQVTVGSIVIDGNSFTKSSVIQNELNIKIGDLITPSWLEEWTTRLQRTGYFNSVEIRTVEEKTSVAQRTLLIKVAERDPGVFTLGAGATNERGLTLRGYTGVAYRNLWGTGRGISLRLEGNYNVLDIKYLESKIVFGYLEPYLLNSRVRGRINLTRSKSVTDYDLKQITEVNQTTYSLEKNFTSYLLGIWEVLSLASVKDYGLGSDYPSNLVTTLDIATTGPTVDMDFRDNPFNPTKGTFTRLNVEYADPRLGGTRTINYMKTTMSFTHYWPLGLLQKQPLVFANNIRYGYLENLSRLEDGGVPYDKKGFILGGRSTIRGYEAGTLETFPNRNDLGNKYNLKSLAQMYLLKSELRVPIYNNFSMAVFYDGGSVQISELSLQDSYRDSAGFGLRYNTPVGPLSLDWAWKLDRRPHEEPWRFHLSFGTF